MAASCGMPTIQYSAGSVRLSVRLAVYFLLSRQLVSRNSIVDRHWLPATDCCQRYLPYCQPEFDVAENLEMFLVRSLQAREWLLIDFPTVKMETRHPAEESFGNEFPSISNHRAVMVAWSCKTLWKKSIFYAFWKNDPLFKIMFRKGSSPHRSTCCVQICWHLAKNRVLLTWHKIRLALQLSLLRRSCPTFARASPRQCIQSAPYFI